MKVLYQSTRDINKQNITSSRAIIQGLAPDGGLYVPTFIPKIHFSLDDLTSLTYKQLAFKVLRPFLSDFPPKELKKCIDLAYGNNFSRKEITPIRYQEGKFFLQLFRGPTLAFKDIALQLFPYLLSCAKKQEKLHKKIVILTATSGDTGSAAMNGFSKVSGIKVIVFYPHNGISQIQEQQMLSQQTDNVKALAVEGNFDDVQRKVKKIFSDKKINNKLLKNNYKFSSANSINIGRLLPQIVYYFYAYGYLLNRNIISSGEKINFSVPTGNFGDIMAGFYAKQMGLPINRLLCASNRNKILTDFFNKGIYDKNRPFYQTNSPAMDILAPSNIERLLFFGTQQNVSKIKKIMKEFDTYRKVKLPKKVLTKFNNFYANNVDDKQTLQEIKHLYTKGQIILDPHTAVASAVYRKYLNKTHDQHKTIVISTASPYKFPQTILKAISICPFKGNQTDAIQQIFFKTHIKVPVSLKNLIKFSTKNKKVINIKMIEKEIKKILQI